MSDKIKLTLQQSEAHVLQAAAVIFSSYIGKGMIHPENEEEMMEKSIRIAIRMSQKTDEAISSDEELKAGLGQKMPTLKPGL